MIGTDLESHDRRFRLHFEGPPTHDHTLPAPALVQALQQMQRVVHLLAMASEGREVRRRARVTHDIERRFPLICRIPEDGGYALPIDLGETGHQLFDAEAMTTLAHQTRGVIRAVNKGDAAELHHLVPDSYFRKSVISELYPTFAATLGLEEETVKQHARFLREAGYLPATVGKRLAYATPRHVASLLAAILVDPRVVKAGAAGEIAHSLRVQSYKCNEDPVAPPAPAAILGLAPDHSFVDGLEALVAEAIQYGDLLGPSGLPLTPIWASVSRPWVSAEISLRDSPYILLISYGPPTPADMTDDVAIAAEMTARYGGGDLHTERRIGEATIYGLAEALRASGE